jgi:hypothetical protein
MEPYRVRPPAEVIELYRKTAEGAVLDVPFGYQRGRFSLMADGVLLSAFHLHPVGVCYNSFKLPVHDEILRIAERMWKDPHAIDDLRALGFGTVVVDEMRAVKQSQGNYSRLAMQPGRLVRAGQVPMRSAYHLPSSAPVEVGFGGLAVGEVAGTTLTVAPPEASLTLTFRNSSASTYRHPDPIEPTSVRVRWRTERGGAVIREDELRVLLPLALAVGEEASRAITLPVPGGAGVYEVTVSPVATPDLVVARHTVEVQSPPAHGDAPGADPGVAARRERGARSS